MLPEAIKSDKLSPILSICRPRRKLAATLLCLTLGTPSLDLDLCIISVLLSVFPFCGVVSVPRCMPPSKYHNTLRKNVVHVCTRTNVRRVFQESVCGTVVEMSNTLCQIFAPPTCRTCQQCRWFVGAWCAGGWFNVGMVIKGVCLPPWRCTKLGPKPCKAWKEITKQVRL